MKNRKSRLLFWMNGMVSLTIAILLLLFFFTPRVQVRVGVIGNGDVTGSGYYKIGAEVKLEAKPKNGSKFYAWVDPDNMVLSYDNPYIMVITSQMASSPVEVNGVFYLDTDLVIILDYYDYKIVFNGTLNQLSLLAPSKLGYTFNGWFTDGARTVSVVWSSLDLDALKDDNTVTFYAKFTANTYTITFNVDDPDSGDGLTPPSAPSVLSATYDVGVALTTYAGSHGAWFFKGWDTDISADSVIYTDGQFVLNLATGGNVNLYAVFSDESSVVFNVSYATGSTSEMGLINITHVNGTIVPSSNLTSVDLGTLGGEVKLNATTFLGYNFDGWYLDNSATTAVPTAVAGVHTITSSVTYYAKYSAKAITTINLYYNGILVQPITILEGHTQSLPNIEVVGTQTTTTWYLDVNNNQIYDSGDTLVSPQSITGGSTAATINLVAQVVEQAEFIFNISEIPAEWRDTLSFGDGPDEGIYVNYKVGASTYNKRELTQIGSTGIYHFYIPVAERAEVEGYEFIFWQDSNTNGVVDAGELKLSNWITSSVAEGEDVQLHFVNYWIDSKWQATKDLSSVKTLSFNANQIAGWGATNLRIIVHHGGADYTITLASGSISNQVYTFSFVEELGVTGVELWFSQDSGHKGSMLITWANISTVTLLGTYNGEYLGSTYVNGWYDDGTNSHFAVDEVVNPS
ncbi:MAG: InlB B-repeat-containing protein [Acholeplasmatales bacterium]|nr:InlB B-repeat-containing protein [Acholeplasmatales bacterium]